MSLCVSVQRYVHMNASAYGSQKEVSDSPGTVVTDGEPVHMGVRK